MTLIAVKPAALQKTQAIVLRVAPVTETSRVVNWMTDEAGRVSTIIKGSQRPKSLFLGQYDLFYTCELIFYPTPRAELFVARECSPVKRRDRFRSDWRAAAGASYLADLVAQTTQINAPYHALFQLLDGGLDTLAERGVRPEWLFWFELEFMKRIGLAPRLDACVGCQRPLVHGGGARLQISHARGGLLCADCADKAGAAGGAPIRPDVLAILASWQPAGAERIALNTRCTPAQQEEIDRLLGLFLRYHLDLRLPSRDTALALIKE
jgi:DNA repair protein RecO (recombination protein O)